MSVREIAVQKTRSDPAKIAQIRVVTKETTAPATEKFSECDHEKAPRSRRHREKSSDWRRLLCARNTRRLQLPSKTPALCGVFFSFPNLWRSVAQVAQVENLRSRGSQRIRKIPENPTENQKVEPKSGTKVTVSQLKSGKRLGYTRTLLNSFAESAVVLAGC